MIEKLKDALNEISEKHISEAAAPKKRRKTLYYLGSIAAVLAVVILALVLLQPLTISAKAVSLADYPKYEWKYREEMEPTAQSLYGFFVGSLRQSLSGTNPNNQAYSPINLYMALALTAELTAGSSRQQILELVNADSMESLRSQANLIWNACYLDDNNQTLLANSLWLNEKLHYDQTVMDLLAANYYTSVYQADLNSPRTNQAIRNWLNSQTKGLLEDAVQDAGVQTSPDSFPVLALYSTVFFQAKWSENVEFSASKNTDGSFHAPGGDVPCTFMNKKELQTTYYWGEDFGAISLGMKDSSQMWLILPDEGKTVDDVLSGKQYADMLSTPYEYGEENGKYMKVNLSLPKFDIQSGSDLKADLTAMGLTDIFQPETADFSCVESDIPVWLTAVNQATRVAIDEKGVTAASYIELPGAGAAMPPEEVIDFVLDRPFLFVITNRYDLPLFAGYVNNP